MTAVGEAAHVTSDTGADLLLGCLVQILPRFSAMAVGQIARARVPLPLQSSPFGCCEMLIGRLAFRVPKPARETDECLSQRREAARADY